MPSISRNKFDRKYNFPVDIIYNKSPVPLEELPDRSVDLVVSDLDHPKHNKSKTIEQEWKERTIALVRELHRVATATARICFFVHIKVEFFVPPWHTFLTQIMIDNGYLLESEIIWIGKNKTEFKEHTRYQSLVTHMHNTILIFSKNRRGRTPSYKTQQIDTPGTHELNTWYKSIWIAPGSSFLHEKGKPDIPTEAAYRLIRMYSERGDVVLVPFAKTGNVPVAAIKTERKFVGYERNPNLYKLIQTKLQNITKKETKRETNAS